MDDLNELDEKKDKKKILYLSLCLVIVYFFILIYIITVFLK